MATRIFVGKLAVDVTEDDLRAAFEPFGTVTEVVVPADRQTGEPRGFGFVYMEDGAAEATAGLDGTTIRDQQIAVREAQQRPPRPDPPF